jgi:uncharacterized Zn finger protein
MAALHHLVVTSEAVIVESPGSVTAASAGAALLAEASEHWRPGPTMRGRRLAANGTIRWITREGDSVMAIVGGSGGEEYQTSLRIADGSSSGPLAIEASCECFYGCTYSDWCKHAVALSFACAALADGLVDDFTGQLVLATVDRAELEIGARRLLAEAPSTTFDPALEWERETRWLDFPFPTVDRTRVTPSAPQ